jgi:hypothetical protein
MAYARYFLQLEDGQALRFADSPQVIGDMVADAARVDHDTLIVM